MARQLYLIAYDVSCPLRLQRTLATVKPWRASGQKSVAECFLSPAERDQLCAALSAAIDAGADRLHIVRLDPRRKARLFGIARQHDGGAFRVV